MAFPGHSARRRLRQGVASSYRPQQHAVRVRLGLRRRPRRAVAAARGAGRRAAAASATRSRPTTARSRSTARRPASGPSTTPRRASPTTACTPTGSRTCAGIGGDADSRSDMWNGAEAYLRDVGARRRRSARPAAAPRRGDLRARGRGAAAPRRATGRRCCAAPASRSSATRAWSWCVRGKRNRRAADVAVLSTAGRVELVGSTARGRSAGGIAVGAPARRLRGGALGAAACSYAPPAPPPTPTRAQRSAASAPSRSRSRRSPAAPPTCAKRCCGSPPLARPTSCTRSCRIRRQDRGSPARRSPARATHSARPRVRHVVLARSLTGVIGAQYERGRPSECSAT